ncbi:glycoside hydrolase family 2 [Mucilaginibacter sp. JRF]|uniref:glycosyl hydrolase n=1 Tax=Mucilaginibacter sp. JRF TaxID=2780088 RepID=UPI0018825B16|nr:glycosyl hydrolase [Mucilaginibacter sp. JRF]MBE9583487.1 glycoside hydrolase family 2 [Mucilaginibacter sp. JRF]
MNLFYKILTGASVSLISLNATAQQRSEPSFNEIGAIFTTAPDTIQTSVYWYWISDNISKEGVIKDLHSMKKMGINRAFIGNIGLSQQETPYGKVKIFTDEWWDILHTALKTATELNIDIGLFNSPGWSQSGGPWIKPEQSMRYLTASQTKVKGGKQLDMILPKPTNQFQDQRLITYPIPDAAIAVKPTLTASPAINGINDLLVDGNSKDIVFDKSGKQEIELTFQAEQSMQSLTIYPPKHATFAKTTLQAYVNNSYQTIKECNIDRQNDALNVGFDPYAPIIVSFKTVKSKKFRLVFNGYNEGSGIAGIELSPIPKVERYPEKVLAKMFPTPLPYWNEYQWPVQAAADNSGYVVSPDKVIDISANMDTSGMLRWKAPKGNWLIMRTGMTSTLVTNSPASPAGTGLEVDKMSKKHAAYHFDSYLGEIMKRIPAADRKSWKVTVQDSYETGGQNWSDDFIAEFKDKYNYDPVPYLPVFKGTVVGSQDRSDRFLWDVRRLVADNVAHKYVAGLREVSHQHGLITWLENYGHWGFPGEFLQYGGQSDEIGGEFWNEGDLGNIENRAASSSAHIYGKRKVSAESFTAGGGTYVRYPALMKQRGDRFFAEGINNTLLHVYITQPSEDKVPGINTGFGSEFNRHNTWYYEMGGFIKYLKRTNYLLQQGLYVADIAYFIGEDAPKMTGIQSPALPKGYSFDYVNGEVIMHRFAVNDGRYTLPDGMSYKVLVLPKLETIRPELLQKIAELVKNGGVVFGPKPLRSPSLAGYPAADDKVKALADELWGTGQTDSLMRPYGKGMVINGKDLRSALNGLKTEPDVKLGTDSVAFLHRKLADGDVYFLTNQSTGRISIKPEFHVSGKAPELWQAVTGAQTDLVEYIAKNGYTSVPLELDVNESVFIVFKKQAGAAPVATAKNFPAPIKSIPVAGAWTVKFDEAQRGPKKPLTFNSLTNWAESANDSVKYYSGAAVYTKMLKVDAVKPGQAAYLDLDKLTAVAKVKVNGQDVGSAWTAPYRVEISKALKRGQNTIEITVTNTWVNRLIGDAALPQDQRKTWLSYNPYKPTSKLQTSGLFGPVVINIYQK